MSSILSAGGIPPTDLIGKSMKNTDPGFDQAKQEYVQSLDGMIAKAKAMRDAGVPFRLFPPVRANDIETIPGMSALGERRLAVIGPVLTSAISRSIKSVALSIRWSGR